MKIGAIYLRVSTEDQAREGYSLDAQLKAIKKYAQSHNILIDNNYIFKDEGISGRKAEKRPAFMEMIKQAKIKPKKFDVILVHKFDRFSRNREDSIVYKSLLKKECGIPVISITEQIDPDDKMSVILEAFLEAMAEYYSINLSGEVKKGQIEKHSKGELQTRPSFGYKAENNKLVIVDEEARIVKYIYEEYGLNHTPIMTIAKKVNELGIKTKTNNKFENRTIQYILSNPVYIGKLTYTAGKRNSYTFDSKNENTILINGQHQPIIPMELWDTVQTELSKNNKFKKPHQQISDSPKHWTKGLIRCKQCGCTMVTNNKTKLRCNGYNKGKCNNNTTLSINNVYSLIIGSIKETINTGTINHIADNKKNISSSNQYDIIKHQLEQLEEKENRIKQAYIDGIDSLDEYKTNKQIIQNEKILLTNKLESVEKPNNKNHKKEIIENGKKVYEILSNSSISLKEKNEIAHILINKIEYDNTTNTLEVYYN